MTDLLYGLSSSFASSAGRLAVNVLFSHRCIWIVAAVDGVARPGGIQAIVVAPSEGLIRVIPAGAKLTGKDGSPSTVLKLR